MTPWQVLPPARQQLMTEHKKLLSKANYPPESFHRLTNSRVTAALSDVCQTTNQGRKDSPKGENACRDLAVLFMSSGRGRVMLVIKHLPRTTRGACYARLVEEHV